MIDYNELEDTRNRLEEVKNELKIAKLALDCAIQELNNRALIGENFNSPFMLCYAKELLNNEASK